MSAYIYVRNVRRAPFARRLARALGIGIVDSTTMPRTRTGNALINWGNSTTPNWRLPREFFWLGNTPEHISVAAHKTRTFEALSAVGVPILEHTTRREDALAWFRNGSRIYARTTVQGHSGEGLVFLDPQNNTEQDVPNAPLYTKDFGTPFKEYRVHVAFGNVIDITQKKRLSTEEILARGLELPPDRERLQVRTYGNGWVFTRANIDDHQDIRNLALRAAQSLNNMPIAVVDIAAEWHGGRPVRSQVIEVNTAPALRSDTLLDAYVAALRPHIDRTDPVPVVAVDVPPVEVAVAEPVAPAPPPPPRVPDVQVVDVRGWREGLQEVISNYCGNVLTTQYVDGLKTAITTYMDDNTQR